MSGYFEIYRGLANSWECDIMGHLNVQFYSAKMSDGLAHFRSTIGLTPALASEFGIELSVRQSLNRYRSELHAGDTLNIDAAVLAVGESSVDIVTDIMATEKRELSAGFDMTFQCREVASGSPAAWPAAVRERLQELHCARRDAPRPPGTGGPAAAAPAGGYATPFISTRGAVMSWECGAGGTLAPQGYMARAYGGIAHIKHRMGLTQNLANEKHWGSAALEYKIDYRRALRPGDIYSLHSGLIAIGEKMFRFGHRLSDDPRGETCAIFDVVGCMFDLRSGKFFCYGGQFVRLDIFDYRHAG